MKRVEETDSRATLRGDFRSRLARPEFKSMCLPGGHISQLGKSLADELTNVPARQGKNFKELSVNILAKPDCCKALRSTPFVFSSISSSWMYSSSLSPTPLDYKINTRISILTSYQILVNYTVYVT